MAISFRVIQPNRREPGFYAEVDPSLANTAVATQRALVIGQMLPTGTATPNVPVINTSVPATYGLVGRGSQMSTMVQDCVQADPQGEVWLLPVLDNPAGVASVTTVTVSGPATGAGTLCLYVAYGLVQCAVNVGDTATVIAANLALAAAPTLMPDLPVTVTAAAGVLTLTARHKGASAGQVDVRTNYLGARNGQATPPGVSIAVAVTTPGSGDPIIDPALANLGDMTFDAVISAYSTAPEITSEEGTLNDTAGRWSPYVALYGHVFAAHTDSFANLITYSQGNNNQHVSVISATRAPQPDYRWAAITGAACFQSLRADPSLPLQNMILPGLAAPAVQDRYSENQREVLLEAGLGVTRTDNAGNVILDRLPTTYQTNAAGVPDNSYEDTETLFQLMYVLRALKADAETKFGRKTLKPDGSNIPVGSNSVTSLTIRNEQIGVYRALAANGICSNPDDFAKNIVAENAGNGTVNLYLPVYLAGRLRVIDAVIAFSTP